MTVLLLLAFQLSTDVHAAVVDAFHKLDFFQVSFRQETYSDFFDETIAEGSLTIQRPGRMRMEYHTGEKKLHIWDGVTCYERDFLADTESRIPQKEVRQEPLVRLLLYSADDLQRYFLIDRTKKEQGDLFRLRPRSGDDYEVMVTFDKAWQPTYLEVIGKDGEGTRFWFQNLVRNPEIDKQAFVVPNPDHGP